MRASRQAAHARERPLLVRRPSVASSLAEGAPEDLGEAYRLCRGLAKTHSKTFYLSSLFVPAEKRRAIWAVYAFCRTADDIIDRNAPAAERLAALDAWERQLVDTYAGRPAHPVFVAFADAAERYAIPIEPALELLRGAQLDVTVRRYATYAELREYCYLVASTVGLLTAPILGYTDARALEYGVALGHAMQMTNILRDIGEDARMGRIYLPAEDMLRFGYTESSVFEEVIDDAFVALMRFQVERVRGLYAHAEPGIAMLSRESRFTVKLALDLYRRILDSIEANGYDVYSKRAYVPFRAKMLAAINLALAR